MSNNNKSIITNTNINTNINTNTTINGVSLIDNAISSCFPSSDSLSSSTFDSIEYINNNFPDESSLFGIDTFMKTLEAKIGELDNDIDEAIKQQALSAKNATRDVSEAKSAILDLSTKIKEIKVKADQSEKMVQEICSDIRRLDSAKRNLTSTKTALTRVSMFLTAVEKLDIMVKEKQYREAANLLDAVNELNKHFDGYERTVPKIRELKSSVARTRDALTKQIFEDIEGIGDYTADLVLAANDDDNGMMHGSVRNYHHNTSFQGNKTPELLHGAFLCADALGPDTRRSLRRSLCSSFLKPYDNIFRPGEPSSGLENTERRYSWLKRLLRTNDEQYHNVFPSSWRFEEHIILDFSLRTNAHLSEILRGMSNNIDIAVLMRALRKTLDFEISMDEKYKLNQAERNLQLRSGVIRSLKSEDETNNEIIDDNAGILATSADASRLLDGNAPALVIKGAISSAFQNHLSLYINTLVESIKDQVAKASIEEKKLPVEDSTQLLNSCTTLFLSVKNSIIDCLRFSNGAVFLELINKIKETLIGYARSLEIRLTSANTSGPSPTGPSLGVTGIIVPGISAGSSTQTPSKKFDIKSVCQILSSSEYCAETISQMETMLKNRIDPSLQDKFDLEAEQDSFYSVITLCIQILVKGLEGKIEPYLQTMIKTNWETYESPGDQSDYITMIGEEIHNFTVEVRSQLSSAYFRNFHDKFAETFIPHYRKSLHYIKKIGDVGAQQLLVDANGLKTIILAMPDAGKSKEEAAAVGVDTFRKYATKAMTECDLLLKLVGMGVSNEIVLERFRLMWPDGTIEDLDEILELRGVKKQAKIDILNQGKKAGVHQKKSMIRSTDDIVDDSNTRTNPSLASNQGKNVGNSAAQFQNVIMEFGRQVNPENLFTSVGAGMGNALGKVGIGGKKGA